MAKRIAAIAWHTFCGLVAYAAIGCFLIPTTAASIVTWGGHLTAASLLVGILGVVLLVGMRPASSAGVIEATTSEDDTVKLCHDGIPCPRVYPVEGGVNGALAKELRERAGAVLIANAIGSEATLLRAINRLLDCARSTAAALAAQPVTVAGEWVAPCGDAASGYYTQPAKVEEVPDAFASVMAEVERATRKFPTWPTDPLHAVAVLGEEFGELTKSVLQSVYEPHKVKPGEVRTEAVQTAAMALRFLLSLDRYAYTPGVQHEQQALAATQQPKEPSDG